MRNLNDIIEQEVCLTKGNRYEIGMVPFGEYQFKMYEKRFDDEGKETFSRFRIIDNPSEYYKFRENYDGHSKESV